MPLPDERPRQSVANLIGRFENQTKRQAPNNTLPPRSSSVVSSHNTGESANHDVKEKREWPPRLVGEQIASLDSSPIIPRTSLPTSQSAPQPVIPPMKSEPETVPLIEPSKSDQKPTTKVDRKDEAEVTAAQPPKQTVPTTPPRTQTTTKPSATKTSPTITSPKSTARVPRQSMGAYTIQPLKPQHTGMSTASITSTKRPTPKPTSTVNPRTPARPFAAAMSSSAVRPKTPSSGLFAPTAASLAKSRSVTSASTSPPVKKIVLSASSSDRLSKPTAASLSKARTLVPPVPPVPATPKQSRSNLKAAVGTPGPPKAGAKVKVVGSSSSKIQPPKKVAANAAPGAIDGAAIEVERSETKGASDPVNGHLAKTQIEAPIAPSEPPAQNASGDVEASEGTADATSEELPQEQPETDSSASPITNGDSSQLHLSDTTAVEMNGETKELQVHQGDGIENIVNLLETVPALNTRPVSIASIPDDVHEIPDEE